MFSSRSWSEGLFWGAGLGEEDVSTPAEDDEVVAAAEADKARLAAEKESKEKKAAAILQITQPSLKATAG